MTTPRTAPPAPASAATGRGFPGFRSAALARVPDRSTPRDGPGTPPSPVRHPRPVAPSAVLVTLVTMVGVATRCSAGGSNRGLLVLVGTALVALDRSRRVRGHARDGDGSGPVVLPDGTVVRGRGRRQPLPPGPLPEFGLNLGRPPGPPTGRDTPVMPEWPVEWIDWPDFRTPRDGPAAAAAIVRAYHRARAGTRVEVTCGGGTGRTGTVIACLAVLAGHPAADAVAWTRAHYRPHAVETPGQRRWIRWFAAHVHGD